ncbi:hypothetical protein BG003_000266, partial [Podila horticola]
MSYCWENMIRIIDGPEVLSLVHEANTLGTRARRLVAQIMAHFYANGLRKYGMISVTAEEMTVETW